MHAHAKSEACFYFFFILNKLFFPIIVSRQQQQIKKKCISKVDVTSCSLVMSNIELREISQQISQKKSYVCGRKLDCTSSNYHVYIDFHRHEYSNKREIVCLQCHYGSYTFYGNFFVTHRSNILVFLTDPGQRQFFFGKDNKIYSLFFFASAILNGSNMEL